MFLFILNKFFRKLILLLLADNKKMIFVTKKKIKNKTPFKKPFKRLKTYKKWLRLKLFLATRKKNRLKMALLKKKNC